MSKPQKEKSVTKDKLIGMKVIDGNGNLVGTVKDVGFTIGKAGISLSVENEDGDVQDIVWDAIQGAADFIVLKQVAAQAAPVTQTYAAAQPTQPAQAAQPVQSSQTLCPTCNKPLTFVQQYQRWYCYNEKKYV